MSRSLPACLSVLVAMGSSTPVAADPPQSEQFVDVGIGAFEQIDCGSFALTYELSGERARITTFFDNEGNPSRLRIHFTLHGTLTHSLTGQTLRDQAATTVQVDLNSGTTTIVGTNFHYAIPAKD